MHLQTGRANFTIADNMANILACKRRNYFTNSQLQAMLVFNILSAR